jgi:DHA3 family macrolide efflux protein-like MFS transporter
VAEASIITEVEKHGPFTVLRNRNFARLFFAGVTSTSGFSIGQVALTWIVYSVTGSALNVALIGVSFTIASVIFSLLAGALVDRRERRMLMIISDVVRATSLAVLTAWFFIVGFNLIIILVVAFVLGSFTTLFHPAERALTPEIVGSAQIADANALVQTTTSIIQFSSNAIAGLVIVALGIEAAFALNSATFVVSALLIGSIVGFRGTPKRVGSPSGNKPSILGDIMDGMRYIYSKRGLLELTISAGFVNFFFAMVFQFYVVYSSVLLKGGAEIYGLLLAMLALGWAPGAFLAARMRSVRFAGLSWILGGIALGFCVLTLVLLPIPLVAMAVVFVMGLILGFTNTTWLTAVQLIVPSEMQGRYFGIDQLGSFAIIPVGQILGGLTIGTLGLPADFTLAGVGLIASAGLFILSPHLRNLRWEGQRSSGSSTEGPS